ncbi:hypothetical protein F2Q69_00037076 [Brassica cretica]|uniref:Transposase-associated domain-containing protein n=1 Tax=Brassica cretica TaxID=69181 RepID=A0A8S9SN45_BRACR|nr:hypothetical protein F2Q69_00037076 [Brassica cretica]
MRSSEYSDEFPRTFRENPSEYTDEIPRKAYSSENADEYPRIYYSRWRAVGDFKNSEEIPRKEPLPSVFRRNFLGTVGSISSINTRTPNLFIHSISSSSHILYLHTNLIEKSMSSSNYYRSWIDRPHLDPNTRLLTEEYQRGITEFMGLVQRQPEAETGMLRCPCSNCKNRKIIKEWDVWTHLYLNGFTRSYKIWYHHGETDYEYGSTSEPQPAVRLEEPIRMDVDYGVG